MQTNEDQKVKDITALARKLVHQSMPNTISMSAAVQAAAILYQEKQEVTITKTTKREAGDSFKVGVFVSVLATLVTLFIIVFLIYLL